MASRANLDAVKVRREALYEAVVGLEDALTTPIGDGPKWRLRVAMALDHAAVRIREHSDQAEQQGGFLDEARSEAPRLASKISQLTVDHERLEKEVDALQLAIASVEDSDIPDRAVTIRNQAVDLLGHLARHRQRGADLVYEIYQVDIGNSS